MSLRVTRRRDENGSLPWLTRNVKTMRRRTRYKDGDVDEDEDGHKEILGRDTETWMETKTETIKNAWFPKKECHTHKHLRFVQTHRTSSFPFPKLRLCLLFFSDRLHLPLFHRTTFCMYILSALPPLLSLQARQRSESADPGTYCVTASDRAARGVDGLSLYASVYECTCVRPSLS